MPFAVTADPVQAVVDAFAARLQTDTSTADAASLVSLMGTGKIVGHLSEATRTAYPYLVVGRTGNTWDSGAMGIPGGIVTLHVDGWSSYKGPYEMRRIVSRVSQLMERALLTVAGFLMVEGSLHCDLSEVWDEPDEDRPDLRLHHGVQRWVCDVHEAA